ncbi:hypothetical protein [Povalibacter sp.]|uniref:hypothetical protein n=1 Tax=Povalibacter sp. TaxID=1962978 RepID=UPI002F415BD2
MSIRAMPAEDQASGEARRRARRERLWAWASLLVLVVAWDAASRLDERAAILRMRITHVLEEAHGSQRSDSTD